MANPNRIVRTSCRSCHGVCQVLVHLDDQGCIVRIAGDPDSPTSRGYICSKGRTALELVHHPDRVLTPLRRSGARGSGRWTAIGWDDALSEMARVFDSVRRESGSEYIALCQGQDAPTQSSLAASSTRWDLPITSLPATTALSRERLHPLSRSAGCRFRTSTAAADRCQHAFFR